MGRSSIPPALMELSSPSTPEAQATALRNLKNEIVGHEQRKELAVVHGVVKPLAGLLRTETRKGGKKRRGVQNGSNATSDRAAEWTTEDELRFQATLVVGSLAIGGPAFVTPLLAGNVLPPLLEALSPSETPAKLLVTTLRTLSQVVDAVAHEGPLGGSLQDILIRHIYTKPVVESLAEILAQPSPWSRTVHLQMSFVARLITRTCREEGHKKMLLDAGVLDLLTARLAAMAAADDPSPPQHSSSHHADALPRAYLADILEAISSIIKHSHYNTARFVYSQHIQNLFAWPKGASGGFEGYGTSSATNNWDRLIPRLQTLHSKSDPYTKSWPALGSGPESGSYARLPSMESLQPSSSRNVVSEESETPLFTWLVFAARRGEGRERLAACWLLALLKKFGERWSLSDPTKTTRERHFSYLIIPLVVRMIEEANATTKSTEKMNDLDSADREEMRLVVERSPLVLAELIASNKTLQNAAVDAKILPTLVQMLKRSFDPIMTSNKPLWQPKSSTQTVRDPSVDLASSTLGRPGLGADIVHAYEYRESALLALAAIADSQDNFRKLIIEMGGAPLIIDSLIPFTTTSNDITSAAAGSNAAKFGNPEAVLIAACKVTRSLSRSVSVLRTSLIDHGIAQPSFDLLTHPDLKVQIAATEVITNLVLEVSPMRTEIIEAGALETLCEHCRSANFDLRYGSLWALKHLCLGLPPHMRKKCLDILGVGWLKQVLNGEPASRAALSAPLGMGTPNAVGEQVDILNAVDDPHMDVDEEPSSSEDEHAMTDSIPSLHRHQRPGSRYTSATNIRDRLQQIKSDEQDTNLSNERDEIRIQEQALDFVRNFITEEKASGEMIDHLLNEYNRSEFFEILDSKLRPKNIASGSTGTNPPASSYWSPNSSRLSFSQNSTTAAQPNWAAYPAVDLIIASLYILVHLANGRPSHRSLLISQTPLMQHILPLLTHPRRDVRLPCAWFVNNLVWEEDSSDAGPTRERAQQLRSLGFEEGVRVLSRDIDLDVRERARTAVEQLGKLLGNDARYGSPGVNVMYGEGAAAGSGLGGLRGLGGGHQGRWGRD